jgi:hypothetical protein
MGPGSHATTPSAESAGDPPSGLPDEEAQDEDVPLGVPPDDEDADRALPGFPEGDVDTAG